MTGVNEREPVGYCTEMSERVTARTGASARLEEKDRAALIIGEADVT
jgi:hypothetical protein